MARAHTAAHLTHGLRGLGRPVAKVFANVTAAVDYVEELVVHLLIELLQIDNERVFEKELRQR